eukprot:TRINITY_DN4916_c0_g1_i1.p1 TRINITY_DN4916_c0_g1~~TRINITY_DN4916_c0_g1_i1.p1  ORF type:complete len:136 (+),score=18.63 TRINITY_DN4916_c0_g1_i1:50-409(+)
MAESKKITIAYWKIRGLAQAIRLLCAYTKTPVNDVRYEQGDPPELSRKLWYDVKETLGLPFPNLPYLIDGDVKITQSNAVLRYVANKSKPELLGTTPAEKAYVDMTLDQVMGLCFLSYI